MSSLNEQGTYKVAVYPISRHTEDKLHTIASILSGHFNPRKSGVYANELPAYGNGWAKRSEIIDEVHRHV